MRTRRDQEEGKKEDILNSNHKFLELYDEVVREELQQGNAHL